MAQYNLNERFIGVKFLYCLMVIIDAGERWNKGELGPPKVLRNMINRVRMEQW